MSAPQRLLVVGGNGFLGSAVCRAAISRGWDVHSLSTSGRPPKMPGGETPAWTDKVTYHSGSAFEPSTFSHLLPETTAVVHSMGILLESDYKGVVREGSLLGLAGRLVGMGGLGENPLKKSASHSGGGGGGAGKGGYERINRDSAFSVLRTLLASKASSSSAATPSASSPTTPTPFVYVSAEDIFRPLIPAGYISSKRQAEQGIQELISARDESQREVTPFIVRPGIMTHPQLRPFLAPLTPLLALSSALPPILPNILRAVSPTPRFNTGADVGSGGESMARFLETRTMDVDEVGEAVCVGIERGLGGVFGVDGLKRLAA